MILSFIKTWLLLSLGGSLVEREATLLRWRLLGWTFLQASRSPLRCAASTARQGPRTLHLHSRPLSGTRHSRGLSSSKRRWVRDCMISSESVNDRQPTIHNIFVFWRFLLDFVWESLYSFIDSVDKRLGDVAAPLLLSVRSGAAISMPGMMDTVLNLGLTDEVADAMAEKVKEWKFHRCNVLFLNIKITWSKPSHSFPHQISSPFQHLLSLCGISPSRRAMHASLTTRTAASWKCSATWWLAFLTTTSPRSLTHSSWMRAYRKTKICQQNSWR